MSPLQPPLDMNAFLRAIDGIQMVIFTLLLAFVHLVIMRHLQLSPLPTPRQRLKDTAALRRLKPRVSKDLWC